MRYLGFPVAPKKWNKDDCNLLVEKVTAQLCCWTTRHLSYAGRTKLVQTILQTLHVFWASAFLLPKGVINEVDKICRKFLWGGNSDVYKAALVGWSDVCLPKEYGGLGLKNLSLWSLALISKQAWDLASKADSLWVRWISEIYLKHSNFLTVEYKQDASWHWKQLLKARDVFCPRSVNGSWGGLVHGVYSVKAGYEWLLGTHEMFRYSKAVWNACILPKHAFILWLLMRQRLLTTDRLVKWYGSGVCTQCVLCCVEFETSNHLFSLVPSVRQC